MLSQLLGVPVGVIRGWERAGLIRPVRRVFRLPYFDFQEVAGARLLAEMIADGVSKAEIEAGLNKLKHVWPDIEQPLVQLEILARDKHVVYRDRGGLVESVSGQRLLDFDADKSTPAETDDDADPLLQTRQVQAHWTADEWFEEANRHLEEQELEAAVEAFRLCLIDDPRRADANFQLAETLYRLGRIDGALERYHVTVELDHNYLEAWTQLGCLHAEKSEFPAALDAFNVALDIHAEYPDAHLHKAEILHQLGRTAEAVTHWQTYLRYDTRGPWAENARRRLAEADATAN
jgi:tetratricopeptide (TPR) repeat protein